MALNIRVEPAPPRTASESETKRPDNADTLVTIYDDETSTEFKIFTNWVELELNTNSRVALIQARPRGLKIENDGFGTRSSPQYTPTSAPAFPRIRLTGGMNG